MRCPAFGVAVLALAVVAGRSEAADDGKESLVGTHVVTIDAQVQFVDREGRSLGVARRHGA